MIGKLVYVFEGKREVCEGRRELVSPNPDAVRLLWRAGITAVILPEFDAYKEDGKKGD